MVKCVLRSGEHLFCLVSRAPFTCLSPAALQELERARMLFNSAKDTCPRALQVIVSQLGPARGCFVTHCSVCGISADPGDNGEQDEHHLQSMVGRAGGPDRPSARRRRTRPSSIITSICWRFCESTAARPLCVLAPQPIAMHRGGTPEGGGAVPTAQAVQVCDYRRGALPAVPLLGPSTKHPTDVSRTARFAFWRVANGCTAILWPCCSSASTFSAVARVEDVRGRDTQL